MNYHCNSPALNAVKETVMLKKFLEKRRAQVVMGYKLQEPRPTWLAGFWAAMYFGLPFLLITVLIDVAMSGSLANAMDCGAIFNDPMGILTRKKGPKALFLI
jgi:hypothetical protein